jgi:hypothetical protein
MTIPGFSLYPFNNPLGFRCRFSGSPAVFAFFASRRCSAGWRDPAVERFPAKSRRSTAGSRWLGSPPGASQYKHERILVVATMETVSPSHRLDARFLPCRRETCLVLLAQLPERDLDMQVKR